MADVRAGRVAAPPQPLPDPAPVPEPRDTPNPGTIELHVDARDVTRGTFRVRQMLPVDRAVELFLLYPKWLPGFHAPQAPIELFAGLRVSASGEPLAWTLHPVTVNAFYIDVPAGAEQLDVEFHFLSPTDPSQGRVLCSEAMLFLPWNTVILYPAGHYARGITVAPRLTLPAGWRYSSALDRVSDDGQEVVFARCRSTCWSTRRCWPAFTIEHHRSFEAASVPDHSFPTNFTARWSERARGQARAASRQGKRVRPMIVQCPRPPLRPP